MEFNSVQDAINYVKNQIPSALNECSYDMQEIMIDEIKEQIYNARPNNTNTRTGQLMDSPQMVEITGNSVTMEYTDSGDWHSVFPPHEHMDAIYANEFGHVWAPGTNSDIGEYNYYPATNLVDESYNKCEQEIPNKFKEHLIRMGIPIE